MKKGDLNDFIEKANIVHNFKYDYSEAVYVNNKTKLLIRCNIHNYSFLQRPNDHLSGKGCDICGGTKKLNTKEFIEKSNIIHNFKYDYSEAVYVNNRNLICIRCKKHDHKFLQIPNSHLLGSGCNICKSESIKEKLSSNTEEFVEKSINLFKNRYDYSKVVYVNSHTKVEIVCPIHKSFWIKPYKHLAYQGCTRCNISMGGLLILNYLDSNKINYIFKHRFEDCRNVYPLEFDFYLPDNNMCIEFDGKHHFESVKKFGGSKTLDKTILRDEIKNDYCINKNIFMYRISYKEMINIDYLLNNLLK